MHNLHDMIYDFSYEMLDRLTAAVYKDGEDTIMEGIRVLDEPEKFVHGHLINMTMQLYIKYHQEGNPKAEEVLKRLYSFIDFIKDSPCMTWGKITLLRGMSDLHDAGLTHIIDEETTTMLKEKTNYEDFVDKSELKVIGHPSNYLQVALACAGYREKLGWEEKGWCEKLLDKLMEIMKAYSDDGMMDEQPPLGRFDRYTLIVPAEIANSLDYVGKPIPQFILEQIKKTAYIMLSMANEKGDGINYGRSLSCHGDNGAMWIIASALRHNLIEEKDIDLAVKYCIKITEKIMNFWVNKDLNLYDIWFNGRSTNQYRQVHRILEVNLDMCNQMLTNLNNMKQAGLDKYIPDVNIPQPEKWTLSTVDFVKQEGKARCVYILKRDDKMLMLPIIGPGYWWKKAAYMPFPVLNGRVEAPPETEIPFLTPGVTLADGSKGICSHYFTSADAVVEDDKVTITADGILTSFDTGMPEEKDGTFMSTYTFEGNTLSTQFTVDADVKAMEMQFAYAGDVPYAQGIGFDEEKTVNVTGDKAYFTPHGGLDNAILWKANTNKTVGYKIEL